MGYDLIVDAGDLTETPYDGGYTSEPDAARAGWDPRTTRPP
ncbi:hypothetical protein [Nonomuraea sp. SYSU D8015]|nr:hypothetical protein [Nonomuraea sp. SYSU D8015]